MMKKLCIHMFILYDDQNIFIKSQLNCEIVKVKNDDQRPRKIR